MSFLQSAHKRCCCWCLTFRRPPTNSNKANKEELGRRCRESYLCPAPHFHYHIFLSILFLAVISSVDCNASLLIAFGCIGEGNWRRRLCRLCVRQSVCFVLSFSIVTILHSILLHSLTIFVAEKTKAFNGSFFHFFLFLFLVAFCFDHQHTLLIAVHFNHSFVILNFVCEKKCKKIYFCQFYSLHFPLFVFDHKCCRAVLLATSISSSAPRCALFTLSLTLALFAHALCALVPLIAAVSSGKDRCCGTTSHFFPFQFLLVLNYCAHFGWW